MNYEEKSDFEIEQAVANHEGVFWHVKPCNSPTDGWLYSDNYELCDTASGQTAVELPRYCSNPSDAWPIIVESMISVDQHHNGSYARVWGYSDNGLIEIVCLRDTILRAAMIVFLMMQEAV